jgi:hypothetical protein
VVAGGAAVLLLSPSSALRYEFTPALKEFLENDKYAPPEAMSFADAMDPENECEDTYHPKHDKVRARERVQLVPPHGLTTVLEVLTCSLPAPCLGGRSSAGVRCGCSRLTS